MSPLVKWVVVPKDQSDDRSCPYCLFGESNRHTHHLPSVVLPKGGKFSLGPDLRLCAVFLSSLSRVGEEEEGSDESEVLFVQVTRVLLTGPTDGRLEARPLTPFRFHGWEIVGCCLEPGCLLTLPPRVEGFSSVKEYFTFVC